ncbi:MAG: hypothetical protein ACKO1G_01070 [Microcystis aeruginosa]
MSFFPTDTIFIWIATVGKNSLLLIDRTQAAVLALRSGLVG